MKYIVLLLSFLLLGGCDQGGTAAPTSDLAPVAPSLPAQATPTPAPTPTPTPVQLTVYTLSETVHPSGVPVNDTYTATGFCTQYENFTYCWDDGEKTVVYNPGSNNPIITDVNSYWQIEEFSGHLSTCLNSCTNDPANIPSVITIGVQNVIGSARIVNMFTHGTTSQVDCTLSGAILDCGGFQIDLNQTALN